MRFEHAAVHSVGLPRVAGLHDWPLSRPDAAREILAAIQANDATRQEIGQAGESRKFRGAPLLVKKSDFFGAFTKT
jgi:hypothetical protein